MHRIKIKNPKGLTQNELEAVAQVLCDTDSEEEIGGEGDISDENKDIEEDKHNSNSEQEISEQEEQDKVEDDQSSGSEDVPLSVLVANREGQYVGKDKTTIWYKSYPMCKSTKPKSKNIIKILPGPKQCARDITDEMSAFSKIVDDEMIEHIIQYTNRKFQKFGQILIEKETQRTLQKRKCLILLGYCFYLYVRSKITPIFWNYGRKTEPDQKYFKLA
ncbi:uncharacterized protein LOC126741492 [Anthonomus grandis grandis]|uniref:uncharacterized protein LOC126741492 n=1 Tax=Anthonomus grandis grandis TaxID=2921223 RepID=UPI0021650AF2|nr:uncharacterized protein LOC126741492 [Anthonomus grandis grandis]